MQCISVYETYSTTPTESKLMQRALRNILMTENGTEKLDNELITTLFENITTLAQLHQFTRVDGKTTKDRPLIETFLMSFTKIPIFVPVIVHEEVVDLVEVVRLLDEHDKFLLFETRSFHSTLEYFFCHNRPGIRDFESLLDSQRESAIFVVPEES